jgi:nucleotide-binding universal stress UspA family protein
MLKISNVLVCTDFSIYSDYAMRVTEKIRKKTNANVTALHVSEFSINWDWMPPNYTEGGYQIEILKVLKKRIEDQLIKNDLKANTNVSMGIISSVILEFIKANKIDLVILGHKGRTGHFSLGSIAAKVIASAPIPVFVIKKDQEIDRISVLVDPYGATDKLLSFGKEFVDIFKKDLNVLSLIPDIAARYIGIGRMGFSTELLSLTEDQKKKIIHETLESLKKKTGSNSNVFFNIEITTEKRISFHLNKILTAHKIDVAIMQKHQSTYLEKILIGSETRRMVEIFEGNIIILPPN